jgi:hypothetical protein
MVSQIIVARQAILLQALVTRTPALPYHAQSASEDANFMYNIHTNYVVQPGAVGQAKTAS